ncbi:carboxylate--amine ligase [Natrinema salifodinae]|uniref:Predicted ATP-dependent carboligase, ATP-grasp superfamily n=1 Tax=Natrinema salifodinae TaxID=1202768 RepID=A0A1I0Q597_9EURY|nr:carboxylate--amine ligase [Natrinema salifodinae]SEW22112.1 Predicted ATP-dependent carboligase, ATP-grasp superfamily [Natrinema salifodinae]
MQRYRDDVSVVVPGIDAPSTVACLRSLRPRGVRTIVGSESRSTPAASSTYRDEFVSLPDPTTDLSAYGDALLSLAERSDVETIIPVREEDIYVLSDRKDAFADEIATPWPNFDTLRRVQDRVELFEAADAAGVAAPETTLLNEWDEWDREAIVKPRYTVAASAYLGRRADDAEIGSTEYQRPGTRPDPQAEIAKRGHVPLVQERIPDSREFGFFALYDHGDPVATFQHCQRRGWKYCGGPSAYRESVHIPELETAGRALLDELEWHGLAMVEFLRDPADDEFKLMEINPRFWSSLPFSVRTGADFPYYYWQLATDEPISSEPTYEVGMGGHLLRGELSYLHSVATEEYPLVERPSLSSAAREVATSLVRQPRFDYAVTDDPVPFFQDGVNLVRAWLDSRSEAAQTAAGEPGTEIPTEDETEHPEDAGAEPTETSSTAEGEPTRSAQTDGGPQSESQ